MGMTETETKRVAVAGTITRRGGKVVTSKTRTARYHEISWGISQTARDWSKRNGNN